MNVSVKEGCISCGLCTDEYPTLFQMNDEGTAEGVGAVPPGMEPQAKEAAEACPVSVIVTTD